MLKPLVDTLKSSYPINPLRIALYRSGEEAQEEVVPVSPCLNCYSISKSFTSIAVGIAQDMGLLKIEDPVLSFFSDRLPASFDPKLNEVQIRHLLCHTTGIDKGFLFETDRYTYPTDDWLELCLSAELKHRPGEVFVYSNSNYYLLSCILEQVTGMPLNLFLQKQLFGPLSFEGYAWECCPKGHTIGATGLYLRTMDLVKFGRMLMQQGLWERKRIVSENWIKSAVTPKAGQPHEKYFYGLIANGNDFMACGAHSQILYVSPDKNTVLAMHAYGDGPYKAIIKDFIYSL